MGQAAEEQSKYLHFYFKKFLTLDKSDISTHLQFSMSSIIYWESPSLQGSFVSLQKVRSGEAWEEQKILHEPSLWSMWLQWEAGRSTSQVDVHIILGDARLVAIPHAEQLTLV